MRWVAPPDDCACVLRLFYARINALTRWLDYCDELDSMERMRPLMRHRVNLS